LSTDRLFKHQKKYKFSPPFFSTQMMIVIAFKGKTKNLMSKENDNIHLQHFLWLECIQKGAKKLL
jgi:hypothetical protein